MSAADGVWVVVLACWCAGTVLMGLCVYERHRSECNLSRRAAQVLSVCALGGAACISELVLNFTT